MFVLRLPFIKFLLQEGNIVRFVLWHSVALASIVGIIVMLYAYVFPHLVPHGMHFVK